VVQVSRTVTHEERSNDHVGKQHRRQIGENTQIVEKRHTFRRLVVKSIGDFVDAREQKKTRDYQEHVIEPDGTL